MLMGVCGCVDGAHCSVDGGVCSVLWTPRIEYINMLYTFQAMKVLLTYY